MAWGGLPVAAARSSSQSCCRPSASETGWLLKNSREEQQASTVAGLMGEYTAAALEVGRATFTACRLVG